MFPESFFPSRPQGASHACILHQILWDAGGAGWKVSAAWLYQPAPLLVVGTGDEWGLQLGANCDLLLSKAGPPTAHPMGAASQAPRPPFLLPSWGERHKSLQAGRFLPSLLLCASLPM